MFLHPVSSTRKFHRKVAQLRVGRGNLGDLGKREIGFDWVRFGILLALIGFDWL